VVVMAVVVEAAGVVAEVAGVVAEAGKGINSLITSG
jgi:hypothetical protein